MKTRMQTDTWIQWTKLALGIILVVSIADFAISALMRQPMPGLLVALGFVSGAGLGKLLISPLNRN